MRVALSVAGQAVWMPTLHSSHHVAAMGGGVGSRVSLPASVSWREKDGHPPPSGAVARRHPGNRSDDSVSPVSVTSSVHTAGSLLCPDTAAQ